MICHTSRLLVVALTCLVASVSSNLVVNGGFETDTPLGGSKAHLGYEVRTPTGWTSSRSIIITQNNGPWRSNANSGHGSFYLGLQGKGAFAEQTITTTPSERYELIFVVSKRITHL